MANTIASVFRLAKAGLTLLRHNALLPREQTDKLPWPARAALRLAQLGRADRSTATTSQVSEALAALGPSYIKLGQFLSTRPDMIGPARAFELKSLQDRLPPFPTDVAKDTIRSELGQTVDQLFQEFGEPVAAASVAQVHKARTGDQQWVAVKILRPGIERRFAADIQSFELVARVLERLSAAGRRLRPVSAVAMLKDSMTLELDLRMEAAALSEMRANTAEDRGFRLPSVDWTRTSKRVLTTQWIDGTPMADVQALRDKGFDLVALADTVIQSFLRHAIRDGFFHADMHQGNLMVDEDGTLVALDLGIMGRLSEKDKMFLAEILYGFIVRDYKRVAQVHFDAGYVPPHQSVENFAQALRAIGEPIMDLPADKISMARLLTQLFEVTEQFDMETQPQLLLLQKTMVVVEGVARTLNPNLNMWVAAEPVVRQWIERKLGPMGTVEQAVGAAGSLGHAALRLPEMLDDAHKATRMLADMASGGGLRLDRASAAELARAQAAQRRWQSIALYAGAAALVVIAVRLAG
jgi:ubiquinone biosynthesis protein